MATPYTYVSHIFKNLPNHQLNSEERKVLLNKKFVLFAPIETEKSAKP